MTFHLDCWGALHVTVQVDYERRAESDGVTALLYPYQRVELTSWLPVAAVEEATEILDGQLAKLGAVAPGVQVPVADPTPILQVVAAVDPDAIVATSTIVVSPDEAQAS